MNRRNLRLFVGGALIGISAAIVARLIRRARSREDWAKEYATIDSIKDTREPALR